jgi:hypothetical protein
MSVARLAGDFNQIGDKLDIVLGHLRLVRLPDLLEVRRLLIRIRHLVGHLARKHYFHRFHPPRTGL